MWWRRLFIFDLNFLLVADTKDLWPKNERDRLDIGPIYNVYAVSRLLAEAGYIDVEPIKWANTPIGTRPFPPVVTW